MMWIFLFFGLILVIATIFAYIFDSSPDSEATLRSVYGISFFGFILIIAGVMAIFFNNGYRTGQADALSGNIKYELVTQPDNSKTWEEIGPK